MNRTVPWSIKGVGSDTREAAKEAARRSGVSLGEWLDGIIAERASKLGVPTVEFDNQERLEAVAVELARLAGRSTPSENPGGNQHAVRAEARSAGVSGEPSMPRGMSPSSGPRIGSTALSVERTFAGNRESAPNVLQAVQGRGGVESRMFGAVNGSLAEALDIDEYESRPTQRALRELSEKLASFEQQDWARGGGDIPVDFGRNQKSLTKHPGPKATAAVMSARERSIRDAVAEITRRQAALDASAGDAGLEVASADRDATAPASVTEAPSLGVDVDPARAVGDPVEAPCPPRPEGGANLGALNDAVSALEARLANGRAATQTPDRSEAGSPDAAEAGAARPPGETGVPAEVAAEGTPSIGRPRRQVRDRAADGSDRPLGAGDDESPAAGVDPRPGPFDDGQRGDGLVAGSTLGEIRALLDHFEPGSTISSLERRMADLAAKIDLGMGPRSSSGQIEDLARQVDEIQSSIRGQAGYAPIEPNSVDSLVRGISGRIEEAREASANIQDLDGLIRSLAAKLDEGNAQPDSRALSALEVQMSRLGDRLERSEASLSALDGVERSLGELFAQLEETRHASIDAAENAARTAARDALRGAMQDPSVSHGSLSVEGAIVGQVTQELSELRVSADASSRRTQATLMGLQQTMEKLVEHLARLDLAGRSGSGPAWQSAEDAASMPSVDAGERRRPEGAPSVRAEPAPHERTRPGETDRKPVESVDPIDTLIEPGSGRAPVRATAASGETEGPASFIAAARRAAHAAQASALATQKAGNRLGVSGDTKSATALSSLERARNFLVQRRRPILLSLAGLVLLLGALEVAKLGFAGSATPERTGAAEAIEPAPIGATASNAGDMSPVATPDGASRDTGKKGSTGAAASPAASPGASSTTASIPAHPQVAPPARPNASAAVGSIKSVAVPRNMNPFLAGSDFSLGGLGEGLRTMALAGDPAAQYEVGLRFSEGRTVGRDVRAAAAWFQKAAAQGLAPAQYRLGSAYEKGIGQPRDAALAMAWYGRAAEAGNMRAMHNLAVMAAEGSVGKPDYAKAATWFRKAAALGVRDSQFNLAILYARGLGIEQSLAQSYTWFAIAASQGDEDAAKKRDEVGARLDAKALASAKAAAESFRPGTAVSAANEVAAPPGGWEAAAPARSAPSAAKGASAKISIM